VLLAPGSSVQMILLSEMIWVNTSLENVKEFICNQSLPWITTSFSEWLCW